MTPVINSLAATLDKPSVVLLPESVRNTGDHAWSELKAIQQRCNLIITDPSRDEAFIVLKELSTKLGHV